MITRILAILIMLSGILLSVSSCSIIDKERMKGNQENNLPFNAPTERELDR